MTTPLPSNSNTIKPDGSVPVSNMGLGDMFVQGANVASKGIPETNIQHTSSPSPPETTSPTPKQSFWEKNPNFNKNVEKTKALFRYIGSQALSGAAFILTGKNKEEREEYFHSDAWHENFRNDVGQAIDKSRRLPKA